MDQTEQEGDLAHGFIYACIYNRIKQQSLMDKDDADYITHHQTLICIYTVCAHGYVRACLLGADRGAKSRYNCLWL